MNSISGRFSSLAAAAFLIAGLAVSRVSHASVKVGTVDLQKALQESKKGRNAKAALEKEFDEKKKKIEAEQGAVRKMGEEFQKKSAVMSEKARQTKGAEVQQKMAAFQELVQKSQMDIQAREGELTKPIIDGLRNLVPDIAKKKNLEMVFEANSVGPNGMTQAPLIYAADRTDLTDDLIKLFDEKNP